MLSYTKLDLNAVETETSRKASSNSMDLLRREGTEYWSRMTGESLTSDRFSTTIEISKDKMVERIEADYVNFIAKLLLQSLCRLQETQVLMYVRDSDITIMRNLVIPWAVLEYKSRMASPVSVRIDHHFRLNELFKGRVVISNSDRSLWVDNDVVAKVEDIAKNVLDRRNIVNTGQGTLKYMRR
uniref:V-type proton ATPase subunit E n=1 Tax=Lygus hesperus TaxID=30085 RepID=A0A0A9XUD1_LYGHE